MAQLHARALLQHEFVRCASDGSCDDSTTAWHTIVERQQREIEALRAQLVDSNDCDTTVGRCDDGTLVDSVSRPLSLLSSLGSVFSASASTDDCVDSDRFAALCAKLQRARTKLVKRDVQLRRARAQISAAHEELGCCRLTTAQLQTRVRSLCTDLEREAAAKLQAVEHAALTLLRNDERETALQRLERSESQLRAEILTYQARALEAERSVLALQQNNTEQQRQIAALSSERDALARAVQSRNALEHSHAGQVANLEQQNTELQLQVESVRAQQQQAVLQLDTVREQHSVEMQRVRDEHSLHVAHLLQENLALQQRMQTTARTAQAARQRECELSERTVMATEELALLHLKDECRRLQLRQCDADYSLLLDSHRELVRAASGMELSRRDLMAALTRSKKKSGVLQRALETLDAEIQQLNRAVATNRNRQQSVARTMREYGKRNRALEDAVNATRTQLRRVLELLRASEKRKNRAVTEASALKRDLVIKQCQRSALLHQCSELESCLGLCQSATSATQTRAQLLQRENSVLQDAVAQLCAYSHELVSSQQLLQRELTKLEVEGKREPCVFG